MKATNRMEKTLQGIMSKNPSMHRKTFPLGFITGWNAHKEITKLNNKD